MKPSLRAGDDINAASPPTRGARIETTRKLLKTGLSIIAPHAGGAD